MTRPGGPVVGGEPERLVLLVGLAEVLSVGIQSLLEGCPGVVVAVRGVRRSPGAPPPERGPDIVVLDGSTAFRASGAARLTVVRERPAAAVLALVPPRRPDLGLRALEQGADGVVSMDWSAARVVETVLAALDGRFVHPPPPGRGLDDGPDRPCRRPAAR